MTIKNKTVTLDGIVEMEIPVLDKRIKELKEAGVSFKCKRGNPACFSINPKRGRGTKKIPVIGIAERDGDVVAQVAKHLTA